MPIHMSLSQSDVSKSRICCFTFISVAALSWGVFLINVSLSYKSSSVWKEVCLFLGSIVSAVSFIFLLLFLEILFIKEMCCCQRHFTICNPENSTVPEDQLETTNQNASNSVSSNWNQNPLRCEHARVVNMAETSSNASALSLSTIPAHMEHHIVESDQQELGLQSQPIYTLLYEDHPLMINSSKMNASVPDMATFVPQRNIHSKFAQNIPSVCFERSPVRTSSQDVVAEPYQQREAHKRNAGISDTEYRAMIETSLNHCDVMPIYENAQPLLSSDKVSQITVPKELAVSRISLSNFNVEGIVENVSPKNLNASDKSKSRHFYIETMVENTIPKDLTLSSTSSPRNVNKTTAVEATIPKQFLLSSKASSRYLNEKTMNASVPDMAKFGRQRNIHSKFAPTIPSVCFERSPELKSSQDVVAAPYQQREAHENNAVISNPKYTATIETSLNQCDVIPLYENVQPLSSSDKMSQITISKELAVSGVCPPNYNVEETAENISPKNLNTSDKSKSRHFKKETMVENTFPKDLILPSTSSPRIVNKTTALKTTIPKHLLPSSKALSRNVNVKATVDNAIPKTLAEEYACSPIYVNVAPKVKNSFPKDTANSDTSSPRSRLI